MKTIAMHAHGGLDVVELIDQEPPSPGPGEICVDVCAAALNHLDLWVRRGWPGLRLDFPHVFGSDAVGRISALGEGVRGWALGQRVIVVPGFGCGRCTACLDDDESLCASYKIYGENINGLMRQQVCVPAAHLLAAPACLDDAQAAALPLAGMTAYHMLLRRGGLRAGETVLVQAGASGVGSMAIQIARAHGARVLATASSEAKRALATRLGAEQVFDGGDPGWRKRVKAAVPGGVDLVIEHVGGAVFEQSLACLRDGGRLVTCGATLGAQVGLDLRHVFFRQLSVVGSTMGTRSDLEQVVRLAEAGSVRPVVDEVLQVEQAQQAQRRLQERRALGKVVLAILPSSPRRLG